MEPNQPDACAAVETARRTVVEAYRHHWAELSRAAVAMTQNEAIVQDLLQETFLRYFVALNHGEQIRHEKGWLRQVLHNLIEDWRRSTRAHVLVALEDSGGAAVDAARSDQPHADFDWIPKAEQMLAPREWECLQLRAEGCDYREIAVAMQIRVGTVGVLLHRATRKLRQLLAPGEGVA